MGRRLFFFPFPARKGSEEHTLMQMDSETRARRWSSLQNKASKLQADAVLGQAADALEDMDAKVRALPDKMRTLRAKGYRYARPLDESAAQMVHDWPDVRRQAGEALRRSRAALGNLDSEMARALAQGRRAVTQEEMDAADDMLERLEDRIARAASDVKGAFDGFGRRVAALEGRIDHLLWAAEQWAEASFDIYPDEALVDACKARWMTRDDEGPKGIFFLTDARVVMEQKEKVATKKVLFITTEKKQVQAMQFAAPIGAVEVLEATDARGGFLGLGKREMLTLRFTAATEGKRIPKAVLRLLGGADNEKWAARIKQVQRGDIAQEAIESAQPQATPSENAAATPPREIPTHCPSCGALFTQSVVKGMRELRCTYCGAVVRL